MTVLSIAARNTARNGVRTALTVLALAVLVVVFVLLRTVVASWNAGADHAAKDRLTTRNRASFGLPLPRRYLDDIRERVPSVKIATSCDWFGGKWSRYPDEFFANLACADNVLDVYPEAKLDAESRERFRAVKNAAIIGDQLAKKFGLHVGDQITLSGTFYPGDWELRIVGIYTASPDSPVDRSSLFFRWDYKNAGVPERQRDQIGWIFTRVDDAAQAAAVAHAIDTMFESRGAATLTQSERAANLAMLGGAGAILRTLDVVCVLVLGIMGLILGNTLAMGARERTAEYGVLRAIGFRPAHLRVLVVGEALVVALLGGVVGLALSYPIVQVLIGGFLEENVGKFFPVFRITALTAGAAVGLSAVLGVLASLVPAIGVAKVPVTDALRRVG